MSVVASMQAIEGGLPKVALILGCCRSCMTLPWRQSPVHQSRAVLTGALAHERKQKALVLPRDIM